MRNEAVQVLKFVLILFSVSRNFSCLDSSFKNIIYCQFTALEFMRSYSKHKFVEEFEILYDLMKTLQRAT